MKEGGSVVTTFREMGSLKKREKGKDKVKPRKKRKKDYNLTPMQGYKVVRTKNYFTIPKQSKGKRGFPFYSDGKTYYTWKLKKGN